MDGADHMEPGPARLAAYVRRHAPAAGYDLDARGEQGRLARDAQMDAGVLARLFKPERVPSPKALWPLAQALSKRSGLPGVEQDVRRCYTQMLVEGGIIPAESVAHSTARHVSSQPITAEVLADQWGVVGAKNRELVRDMLERLRLLAQQTPDDQSDQGSAEARG